MFSYPEESHNYGFPFLSWKGVTTMKHLRLLLLVVITVSIASVLLMSGCGDDDDIVAANTTWQKVIGPSGGTVVVTDRASFIYGMKIEIPAGALARKSTITIIETGVYNVGTWPAGTGCWYGGADLSSSEPLLKNIKITFPVPISKLPSNDEELLSAFYLKNDTWTPVLPSKINNNQMIVETDHLSRWTYGRVSLDEVEPGTVAAALEEIFHVDDLDIFKSEVGNKIAPFTSTLDDWTDYFSYWENCSGRQAVADILHEIIRVTEAGITEYLGTQSVIDACDSVYVCKLKHMLLTDEQGRLMKWIETEVRLLFAEQFWGALPGFGGTAGDVLMDALGKGLLEAQYRGAVKYELGCDYRCIFKQFNFNFYVNVLACNVSYIALFGMDVYEYYNPCTP
jgi:hypothetical protein